jgi:hypothetical protein
MFALRNFVQFGDERFDVDTTYSGAYADAVHAEQEIKKGTIMYTINPRSSKIILDNKDIDSKTESEYKSFTFVDGSIKKIGRYYVDDTEFLACIPLSKTESNCHLMFKTFHVQTKNKMVLGPSTNGEINFFAEMESKTSELLTLVASKDISVGEQFSLCANVNPGIESVSTEDK